jgi:hypothetical protein
MKNQQKKTVVAAAAVAAASFGLQVSLPPLSTSSRRSVYPGHDQNPSERGRGCGRRNNPNRGERTTALIGQDANMVLVIFILLRFRDQHCSLRPGPVSTYRSGLSHISFIKCADLYYLILCMTNTILLCFNN